MIDIKTQTRRVTKWNQNIVNFNSLCNGLEFGVTTSRAWGDFEMKGITPTVTFKIDGIYHEMPIAEFIDNLKRISKLEGGKA